MVWFFKSLGFTNVQTVISSGNVIFESDSKNVKILEKEIEDALPKKLDFKSTTIIRSAKQLENLVKKDPFKGKKDTPTSRLKRYFSKKKRRNF